MAEHESLGDRLRTSREQQNLSQQALAVAAGVNGTVVSRLERGRTRRPNTATLQLLAYALDVDPCWLRDGPELADDNDDVPLLEQPAHASQVDSSLLKRLTDYTNPQSAPSPTRVPLRPNFHLAVLATADGRELATLSCQEELGPITIGRGSEAQIRVADAYLSRVHATMHWDADAGTHIVTDAGSANGTLVNGRRVTQPTPLRSGARLRIGRTELRYVVRMSPAHASV